MKAIEPDPDQQFPGKQEGEKVTIFAHRHWIAFLPDIMVTLVAAFVPIAILTVLSALGAAPFEGTARNVVAVVVPAYYLGLATWTFVRWLDYYLDLAIVTDRRVLDIDQYGLFRRRISELHHEVVQDVSTEKDGPLQTFFDFGTVVVQTAGERENFQFGTMPQPEKIAEKINEMGEAAEANEGGDSAEKLEQAAEKMEEAAEKLASSADSDSSNAAASAASTPEGGATEAPSSQVGEQVSRVTPASGPNQPPKPDRDDRVPPFPFSPPPVPPTDSQPDLPREYER